jgi:MSHA pilin protein MshD
MIELVLFIVIVGIAAAGVLMVMVQSNRAGADPQMRKQAISIAEGLLEEIQLARFTYCDPADETASLNPPNGAIGAFITGTPGNPGIGCKKWVETVGPEKRNVGDANDLRDDDARPFDNVNDYVAAFGVEEPLMDIQDVNGATVGNLTPYTAFLTITPESLGVGAGIIDANASDPSKMEVLRIRVRVHYASEDVVLDGYRTRYAPNLGP